MQSYYDYSRESKIYHTNQLVRTTMLCIHQYHAMRIILSNFYVINVCQFFLVKFSNHAVPVALIHTLSNSD